MCQKMVGWVVSLWIDVSQVELNNRDHMPYLSWSPYDRVTINEVRDFSNFFNTKESPNWNGTVQRLHLVPMGKCQWRPGDKCLINTSNSEYPYGIYCIVTARFQCRIRNVEDVEERIYSRISESLQNRNVEWQGFRSLGAEDFVGIFLANNIADLAKAVEIIKQITYTSRFGKRELFDSVCSFLGLNMPDFQQEPKANLLVKLYLKSNFVRKSAYEQLENYFQTRFADSTIKVSIREIISGKGCFLVEIPNHINIFSCFYNKEDAVFNGQSLFYKTYIESSRTYWYISDKSEWLINGNIEKIDVYEEKDLKKNVSENLNIHPISKFILKEYERMMNSHRCLWWRSILQYQCEVYTEFVEEYTKEGNQVALCTLNNKVQTVLLHINQATAPIYEVPYHNYYYSGSYNDVLRMYYGVIAAIFNLAYKLPRSETTYQYEIAYCVDFEAATKVHSSMYKLEDGDRRFVIFHLPYDAFMKFDKTIKLLLHEVFHYVAPYDRRNRNFIFIKIWMIHTFELYIGYLEKKGLSQENSKNIVEYFLSHYGELCKVIEGEFEEELYTRISNDFTTPNKIKKLRKVPEKICEIICDRLNQDLKLYFKEVEDCCTYQMVYPELFGIKNIEYLMESIRRVALAAKEAFCDLNMIYILNLSLKEYLMLLYDALFEKYKEERVNGTLKELIKKNIIAIGSFELRIGMVLDHYYFEELSGAELDQYREKFHEEIRKIEEESSGELKLFYDYLTRIYNQYLETYRRENPLFKELFAMERQWFASFRKNEYRQEKLQKAVSEQKSISENISVILDFINIEIEKDYRNTNKKYFDIIKYARIRQKWQKQRIEICSLGDYIEQNCKIIQEWGDNIVWFRGLCNASFSLTPSLFRNLDEELSLYANQARFLKEAYYITISEATLWTEKLNSRLEHMCLLQHYGMPTSLLDFSDDMLIALHFALNPDVLEDLENVDKYIYQPKVVLFNPFRYNEAVISLQHGKLIEQPKNISPILLDEDDQIWEYCVKDMSKEYLRKHSQEYTKDYKSNPRINKYPQPIVVRRANARIQAQKGTFLAYNLFAYPEKEGKEKLKYYEYIGLERIQEDYFKLLEELAIPIERGEFIKEIYINKLAIPTIKKQLKTMNITTAHAYPELFRVFAEHMDKIKI